MQGTLKEKQGLMHVECHRRDFKMGQQPVGATGAPFPLYISK